MSESRNSRVINDLDVLMRARYPLIYVVSWEERRVEKAILDLVKDKKQVFTWTITQGITRCQAQNSFPPGANEATRDPVSALDEIRRHVVPEDVRGAIFILKDYHPYMSDPTVVRKLRDLSYSLPASYKSVVLLSPALRIPPELEKDITVIDYPLPDLADLGDLLDGIAQSFKDHKHVRVDLSDEAREQLLNAALGLTLTEAENVLMKAIVTNGRLAVDDVPIILSEKEQIVRKSGLLEYYSALENIEDVGGLTNLKGWLSKRASAFGAKARDYGLPQPKGIMLIGVSGSGKSLVAKAVASLWKLPLLRLDVGTLFSGIVGGSEENLRRAIRAAESVAPVILWTDEFEKAFSGSYSSGLTDGGTTARVFSTFLTWMQEKTAPVFIIATANNIHLLPPELLRKGRFDEIFFLDLPTGKEREEIFNIHLRKRKRDPGQFDTTFLARASNTFSGSEIEQAIISAMYESFEAQRDLQTSDIVNVIRQSVPLAQTMREEVDGLRKWAQTRARAASGEQSFILPDSGPVL